VLGLVCSMFVSDSVLLCPRSENFLVVGFNFTEAAVFLLNLLFCLRLGVVGFLVLLSYWGNWWCGGENDVWGVELPGVLVLKMTRELKEECRASILSYPFPILGKFPLCNCSCLGIASVEKSSMFLLPFSFLSGDFSLWILVLLINCSRCSFDVCLHQYYMRSFFLFCIEMFICPLMMLGDT